MEKSPKPDQQTELGDPELRDAFEGLMSDWKEGKLSYDQALAIYTAKALQKAIERADNNK